MAEELLAGLGTGEITPPVGVELCGFGPYLERKSTGLIEPLLARSLVVEQSGTRAAIIACDLVGVNRDLTAAVRTEVSSRCGIPEDNIIVCGTHTHSGPSTIDLIGWGEKDPTYLAGLPDRIASSASEASKRMGPVTLSYGEAEVTEVSFNREDRDGITDTKVRVLALRREGALVGLLAGYSCHPVVMCAPTSLISGDFVGLAVNRLMAETGGTAVFLQGSSGDQNPIYRFQPLEEATKSLHILADRFAGCIRKALAQAMPLEAGTLEAGSSAVGKLRARRRKIELPQSVPDRSLLLRQLILAEEALKNGGPSVGRTPPEASGRLALPQLLSRRLRLEEAVSEAVWARYDRLPLHAKPTEIQALRLGELAFVTHPAELFFEYHRKIESALAPLKTFVIGYANDYVGYIPTPRKFDVSRKTYSYPAYFVPFLLGEFPYRPDAGEVLASSMIDLVRKCGQQGETGTQS